MEGGREAEMTRRGPSLLSREDEEDEEEQRRVKVEQQSDRCEQHLLFLDFS